jgi:hypothetical protein
MPRLLTMTFTTAAFDRSSSWQFEASSCKATPRGPPSSLHTARRFRAILTQVPGHHLTSTIWLVPEGGSLQDECSRPSICRISKIPAERHPRPRKARVSGSTLLLPPHPKRLSSGQKRKANYPAGAIQLREALILDSDFEFDTGVIEFPKSTDLTPKRTTVHPPAALKARD